MTLSWTVKQFKQPPESTAERRAFKRRSIRHENSEAGSYLSSWPPYKADDGFLHHIRRLAASGNLFPWPRSSEC
jgi:hypothetical protein